MRSPALSNQQFLATAAVMTGAVLLQLVWMPLAFVIGLVVGIALRCVQRILRPGAVHVVIRIMGVLLLLWASWSVLSPIGQRAIFGGLLASMLSLKLLETERIRDARLVIAFGSFLAMTAFLFDQGPVQSLATAIVVLLSFATLHELVPGRPPRRAKPAARQALAFSLRLVAWAIPFALVLFVLFPRLERPLWSGADDPRRGRTGMSNRLEPGQYSSLALDDTPVFRVEFKGEIPPPNERYFRGMVFWLFDGRGWTGERIPQSGYPAPPLPRSAKVYEYEVMMEPTDQRWLFLLDAPIAVSAGRIDASYVARTPRPVESLLRFTAQSAPEYRMEGVTPAAAPQAGLQGRGLGNPRSRALAEAWRAKHGDDALAIAQEALALYNASFIYSLDPPMLGANPIDEFVFDTRIGFCEHFASSFAFLMRSAGVPARIVGGYLGGYYNREGNYFLVLNSDAHAWAEIWVEGRGWVRVDPTAAVAPDRVNRSAREWRSGGAEAAFGNELRDGWDRVGLWWNRLVVEFNARTQQQLFERMGFPDVRPRDLAIVMVVLGGATLGFAAWLGFRARTRLDPIVAAWRKLGARLAKLGVVRAPNEGPVAFAERAASALPGEAETIRALSRDFVRLRYARSARPTAGQALPDMASGGLAEGLGDARAFRRAVARFRPRRATPRGRGPS